MSKLPKAAPSLRQFLLQQEVKKLYRQIFRTIRKVPDEGSRNELKVWARTDFKNNKHHQDEYVIKIMIQQGQKSLKELENSLKISR